MTRLFANLAVIALLVASHASAQGRAQDEYDAFGITNDGATLDQAAPDDGSAPPALPKLDGGGQSGGGTRGPPAPIPAEPPPAVAAGLEVVPAVRAARRLDRPCHADDHRRGTADFIEMEKDDDQAAYFRGDAKTHLGLIFGISYEFPDSIVPREAKVSVDKEVSLDGQTMRWREFSADLDATHQVQAIVLNSPEPVEGRRVLLVAFAAVGVPLEDQRALIQQMLGTVRLGGAANPNTAGEALDGLVGYEVPKDWHVMPGSDGRQISFWPAIYSGSLSFARGEAVTGRGGTDADIPAGTQAVPAEIFGQPADLYSWTTNDPEFQILTSMLPGRRDYYRLNGCTGGDAVAVTIAGVPTFIDGAAFRAALDGFKLNLPEGLETCPRAAALPGAAGRSGPAVPRRCRSRRRPQRPNRRRRRPPAPRPCRRRRPTPPRCPGSRAPPSMSRV